MESSEMVRKRTRDISWDSWIEDLWNWKEIHGNLNIPINTVLEDGRYLGVWLNSQKQKYQEGRLEAVQMREFEKLGVHWKEEIADWEEGYAHAEACFKEKGTIQVPGDYVCRDGFLLGNWLDGQRLQYLSVDYNQEWANRLGALGIIWNIADQNWWNAYREAEQYAWCHGNLDVPKKYKTRSGLNLLQWLSSQRTSCREGKLKKEYIEALNRIHFDWENM